MNRDDQRDETLALGQWAQGQGRQVAEGPLTPRDPAAIGDYRLLGRLGSGGMGVVYLGQAPGGQPVAVKVIRADLAVDPAYRARFLSEVDSAKKVASFCTAGVLDHGEDAGMLYMVTEFIEGVALDAYVSERGPLQASVLHATAVGVAAALTAIHAAGLIHRDLKPSNVLLSMGGPRVIDFGIARSAEAGSGHTQAGLVVGSAGWMAPELFDDHVSPAADVFAWGCMIAYAALGRHPFGEGDAMVMAARMRHAQPDLSGLVAPLDRLVAEALNPDPGRRPSARRLLLELVGSPDAPGDQPVQLAATRHLTQAWDSVVMAPLIHQGGMPGRAPHGDLPGRAPHGDPPAWGPRSGAPSQGYPGAMPAHDHGRPRSGPPGVWGHGGAGGPVPAPSAGPPPGWTPPVVPQPAPRPPAARPKRRGCRGCLLWLVLVLVVTAVVSAVVRKDDPGAASAGPGVDGQFRFTVSAADCTRAGRVTTERTCRINVKVTNAGEQSRTFGASEQKVLNAAQDEYSARRLLDKVGAETGARKLDPGESFTGTLIFEVPGNFRPALIELHDSALSGGIRLRLSR
ncbi:serine/threonine-protein kinase [Planotetraspora kaengkrachanensis]|uniref:serine/threonine-protein kinase n=1 Tax=Planotetraspora kaengkrachanensis TaxID=575193 RepID=UPI00194323D5|nr:serine/threonine-protein kinase [Planotetraspora kaengkrachanensis]